MGHQVGGCTKYILKWRAVKWHVSVLSATGDQGRGLLEISESILSNIMKPYLRNLENKMVKELETLHLMNGGKCQPGLTP